MKAKNAMEKQTTRKIIKKMKNIDLKGKN